MRIIFGLVIHLMLATLVGAQTAQAPDAALAEAAQLIQDGKLDAAAAQLQKLQQRGRSAAVLHYLGVIEQKRGAHAKAVLLERQALQVQNDFGPAHLSLGVSLLALNKVAEAITSLKSAVTLLPDEPSARVQLAKAFEYKEDWFGVVEQYQQLRERFPQEPNYAYQLGRAYARLGEWGFERIIKTNPDAARLHQALGQQYVAQGKYELALAEYHRAAQVDARLPEIHLGLAVIHFEQQRYEEALREIELELKLVPASQKARDIKTQIEKVKR